MLLRLHGSIRAEMCSWLAAYDQCIQGLWSICDGFESYVCVLHCVHCSALCVVRHVFMFAYVVALVGIRPVRYL